jgi:hypothetical protein
MKIFISYRRDDTGGRAGRLFDLLAARYGAGRVFQDVTAVAPGTYFDDQVDSAIATSDVVLVVIGPSWLTSAGGDGTRKIDRPDDYVRHEVRAALQSDVRVVPVLVDDAELPSAAALPEDLAPLVRRQAVSVRDESWHRDVDDLINRLEKDTLKKNAANKNSGENDTGDEHTGDMAHAPRVRQRRTAVAVGVGAIVLLAVAIVAALLLGDDPGEETDGTLPPCSEADGSWSVATVTGSAVDVQVDGYDLRIEPRSAIFRPDGDRYIVQVELAVANIGSEQAGTVDDDIYVSEDHVAGLLVDGIKTDDLACSSAVGDQQLAPGQAVVITWGWVSSIDPAGVHLVLAMDPEGNVPIGVG